MTFAHRLLNATIRILWRGRLCVMICERASRINGLLTTAHYSLISHLACTIWCLLRKFLCLFFSLSLSLALSFTPLQSHPIFIYIFFHQVKENTNKIDSRACVFKLNIFIRMCKSEAHKTTTRTERINKKIDF